MLTIEVQERTTLVWTPVATQPYFEAARADFKKLRKLGRTNGHPDMPVRVVNDAPEAYPFAPVVVLSTVATGHHKLGQRAA